MPASITSNWDFTAVINLLHSPAYSGGDFSGPSHESEEHVAPSSNEGSKAVKNASDIPPEQADAKQGSSDTPRLGDFGSLWDALGQNSAAAFEAEPAEDHRDADATPRAQSPQITTPIKILKRPTQEPPRTPPKSIPGSNTPKSRRKKGNCTTALEPVGTGNKKAKAKSKYETNSSDTAEAESDGNVSIFDPPLSNTLGTLSSKPAQFDTSVKGRFDDSPPSSFDEIEGSLTAETIKTATDHGMHRIRTPNKTTKKQSAGLLEKLTQNFPGYAETSLGLNAGDSPWPIHVFVDISNVSLFLANPFAIVY